MILTESQIIEKYNNYIPVKLIAKECRKSKWWVNNILKKYGVIRERFRYSKSCLDRYACLIKYMSDNLNVGCNIIAKQLHIKVDLVKKIYKIYGIKYRHRVNNYFKLTEESKQKIKSLYISGKSVSQIEKILGCANTPILNFLKKENIKIRPANIYDFDRNLFINGINTPELAWLWGLWLTDGNVFDGTVTLAMTDGDVVYKVKDIFKYTGKIYEYQKKHYKKVYTLRISNRNLFNIFVDMGCPPNKSHILDFPNEGVLDSKVGSHFIRGAMDGDGYISRHFSITGSRLFLLGIKDYISNTLALNKSDFRLTKSNNSETIANLYMCKKSIFKPILDWMYSGSTENIRMDRKYNSYKNLFSGV